MASIFISGGAAGIGLATAERFGREGWTVRVYDVDEAALADVQMKHPEWITGTLDVRDMQRWEKALSDFTSHTGGTLDVLDNNAGVLVASDLEDISADAVKAQMRLCLHGEGTSARGRADKKLTGLTKLE